MQLGYELGSASVGFQKEKSVNVDFWPTEKEVLPDADFEGADHLGIEDAEDPVESSVLI